MDFLVKHFGMVVLYAACAVVVLGLVFLPGQSGLLNHIGSTMSGWRATDTSGYSISDIITAKDCNGYDARLVVLGMTLPGSGEAVIDRSAVELAFPVRGMYTLRVEARDSSQRTVIKELTIPVN